MPYPQLLGAGSINHDTQVAYTISNIPVGTIGVLEGTAFVWCSHSGSEVLARGEPLMADTITPTTHNLTTTTNCLGVGSTVITGITAGATAITANAFQNGYLMVVDGGGQGSYYKIRDHTAFTAATADGSVTLWNPIEVASDASTEVSLIKNKYADPQKTAGGMRRPFIGVPQAEVPAGNSSTQYFWAQRLGYCPVFVEGTPERGTPVTVSSRRQGRLAAAVDEIEVYDKGGDGGLSLIPLSQTPVVGQMASDAIDGEVQIVDLQNSLL
jgi:hypothetical protein